MLALVNLLARMMPFPTLSPTLRLALRDFDEQRKTGVDYPVFEPGNFPDLDLDRSAWDGSIFPPEGSASAKA